MLKSYIHVTRDTRSQIQALIATGCSLREIATVTEKLASTISREIARNSGPKGYQVEQADQKAAERRKHASGQPR